MTDKCLFFWDFGGNAFLQGVFCQKIEKGGTLVPFRCLSAQRTLTMLQQRKWNKSDHQMKYIFASKLFIFRALPTRDVPCKLRGTLALLNLPIGRLWDLEDSKQTDRSTVRRFLLKTFRSRSMLAFSCSTWLHKSFSTLHTFVVFHLQRNFQRWQWCPCIDITPLCLFMWTDSCWLCVNCFGQREQWKSLIPRWIFSCDLSTYFFCFCWGG